MAGKKVITKVSAIVLLISLIPISIYVANFWNQSISDKTSDWGDFATYLTGFMNLVIGALNIYLVYQISLMISRLDDRRFLNNIVYEVYKEVNDEIGKVIGDNLEMESAKNFASYIIDKGSESGFLFEDNQSKFNGACIMLNRSASFIAIYLEKEPFQNIEGGINIERLRRRFLTDQIEENTDEFYWTKMLLMEHHKFSVMRAYFLKFIKDTLANKHSSKALKTLKTIDYKEHWELTAKSFARIYKEQDSIKR